MQLFGDDVEKLKSFSVHLVHVKRIVQFFKNRHVAAEIFSKFRAQYGIKSILTTAVVSRWDSSIKSIEQLQISDKALQSSVVGEEIASSIPQNQHNIYTNQFEGWY